MQDSSRRIIAGTNMSACRKGVRYTNPIHTVCIGFDASIDGHDGQKAKSQCLLVHKMPLFTRAADFSD